MGRLPAGAAFVPVPVSAVPGEAAHVAGAQSALVYAALGVAYLPFIVLGGMLGWTAAGQLYAAAPVVLVAGAWGAWALRRVGKLRSLDEAALARGFEHQRGGEARVRIACRPWWGALLLAERELDAAFEPEIARVPLAVGVTGADRRLAVLGALAGLAAAMAVGAVVSVKPQMFSFYSWLAMGAAGAGAVALPEFCAPTYVRIVPGRLDVIRFSVFRRRPASVASFDLRRSRVLVDVKRAVVSVEPPDANAAPARKVRSKRWPYAVSEEGGPRRFAVGFVLTPSRRRLLQAACAAALSEAPTPELPADELLG